MKLIKSKKSEAGLVAVLIIIVIVFFLGWVINLSQRECKSNRDCSSESYCGSDFSCHTYPTIQKTVVQYNFFWPAVIITIAIIAAMLIYRWDKIRPEKVFVEEHKTEKIITQAPEEAEEISEPYYKNTEPYYKSGNSKTP